MIGPTNHHTPSHLVDVSCPINHRNFMCPHLIHPYQICLPTKNCHITVWTVTSPYKCCVEKSDWFNWMMKTINSSDTWKSIMLPHHDVDVSSTKRWVILLDFDFCLCWPRTLTSHKFVVWSLFDMIQAPLESNFWALHNVFVYNEFWDNQFLGIQRSTWMMPSHKENF